MFLYRNEVGRLAVAKYPTGGICEILAVFDNEQLALIAMQSQISDDIEDAFRLIGSLRNQKMMVTRAIQNLYI